MEHRRWEYFWSNMNYNSIEQILKKANVGNSSEYVYLIDGKGEIIYHPRQKLIYTDLYQENNIEAAGLRGWKHGRDFSRGKNALLR